MSRRAAGVVDDEVSDALTKSLGKEEGERVCKILGDEELGTFHALGMLAADEWKELKVTLDLNMGQMARLKTAIAEARAAEAQRTQTPSNSSRIGNCGLALKKRGCGPLRPAGNAAKGVGHALTLGIFQKREPRGPPPEDEPLKALMSEDEDEEEGAPAPATPEPPTAAPAEAVTEEQEDEGEGEEFSDAETESSSSSSSAGSSDVGSSVSVSSSVL